MTLCSASWLIMAYTSISPQLVDGLIGGGSSGGGSGGGSKYPSSVSDPYFTSFGVDNPASEKEEGGEPYFTSSVTKYNGQENELTITGAGVKALFGEGITVAQASSKYLVEYAGGLTRDGKNALTNADHIGKWAGTHYYRISDGETGQVLFYKYEVVIEPDTLNGSMTLSKPLFDGDNIEVTVRWKPNNGSTQATDTISGTYIDPNNLAVFTGTDEKCTVSNYTIGTDVLEEFIDNIKDTDGFTKIGIRNNFDIANSTAATGSYDVYARAYTDANGTKIYYGNVVGALEAANNNKDGNDNFIATKVVAIPGISRNDTYYLCNNTIDKNVTVGSNVTLLVPFSSANEEKKLVGGDGSHDSSGIDYPGIARAIQAGTADSVKTYRKNLVTIKQGATLTVNGTVMVAATITGGWGGTTGPCSAIAGNYAEILMESGTLNERNELTEAPAQFIVNNGGKVNCYGFINSSGGNSELGDKPTVTVESGGMFRGVLSLIEHHGGSNLAGYDGSDKTTTPFNRFYIRSISSDLYVKHGATFNGFYTLFFGTDSIAIENDILVVGNSDSSFFQFNGKETVIRISYDTKNHRTNFDSYGGTKINSLVIEASFKLGGVIGKDVTMSTEKSYMPISYYWRMNFWPDSSGTAEINVPKQNIKILPGGYINIHKGVTVTAQSIIVYGSSEEVTSNYESTKDPTNFAYPEYVDAQGLRYYSNNGGMSPLFGTDVGGTLIVGGKLILQGGLGGLVQANPEESGGEVIMASNTATSAEIAKFTALSNVTKRNVTKSASGGSVNNLGTATTGFDVNKHYVSRDDGTWYRAIKMTYHYNYDALDSGENTVITELVIPDGPSITLTGDNYPEPSRKYYDFGGWYGDASFSNNLLGQAVNDDLTLYGKWSEHVYSVEINSVGTSDVAAPPSLESGFEFTINSENIFDKIGTPTYDGTEGYIFIGWFKDEACTQLFTEKSNAELIENGCRLYGLWGKETGYKITYRYDGNVIEDTLYKTVVNNGGYVIPDISDKYNDHLDKPQAFVGWKLDTNGDGIGEGDCIDIEALKTLIGAAEEGDSFTLVAEWRNKTYSVTVESGSNSPNNSKYSISISQISFYSDNLAEIKSKIFVGTETESSYDSIAKSQDNEAFANRYFVGWTFGESAITVDNFDEQCENNKTISLKPTWADKYSIKVTHSQNSNQSADKAAKYKLYISPYQDGTDAKLVGEYENAGVTAYIIPGYYFKFDMESYSTNGTSTNIPTVFTKVTGDCSYTIKSDEASCIAAGTLITLADGSVKRVEDIVETDILLVFDHETGRYVAAPIVLIERDGWAEYNVINLRFSDGRITRLIYEHALFDITLNKYVYIKEANLTEFIGHEFAVMDGDGYAAVTLTEAFVTTEYTGCFSLATVYHLNYFIDGLFSLPGGLEGMFNIFEYGDGLKYDEEKMAADIEEYGLFTYEDFAEYIPEEIYAVVPAEYLKVSIGKGYITFERILEYIERYIAGNGLM